jgi:hypothetical protein
MYRFPKTQLVPHDVQLFLAPYPRFVRYYFTFLDTDHSQQHIWSSIQLIQKQKGAQARRMTWFTSSLCSIKSSIQARHVRLYLHWGFRSRAVALEEA